MSTLGALCYAELGECPIKKCLLSDVHSEFRLFRYADNKVGRRLCIFVGCIWTARWLSPAVDGSLYYSANNAGKWRNLIELIVQNDVLNDDEDKFAYGVN